MKTHQFVTARHIQRVLLWTFYSARPFLSLQAVYYFRCLSVKMKVTGHCHFDFFFYCSIRRQSNTLLNGSTHEFLCYCVENLFSLKPTALYSASPPAYKHYGTLHCGSSLPINLYLSASVELRALLRCYSSSSISKSPPFSIASHPLLSSLILCVYIHSMHIRITVTYLI